MIKTDIYNLKEPSPLLKIDFIKVRKGENLSSAPTVMKVNKSIDTKVVKVIQLLTGRVIDHTFPVEYRIRDDDTATAKIVVGLAVNKDITVLKTLLDAQAVKYFVQEDSRCLIEDPNISLYLEDDAVVISYRKKEKGIFEEHLSDIKEFQKLKTEMWELASLCTTDIKHTAICYNNNSITVCLKTSNINRSKLYDIEHISPNEIRYKDRLYTIKFNRIVHTFSPND